MPSAEVRPGSARTLALVRALLEANPKLGLRALATAQGVSGETLREALTLSEDDDERAKVYLELVEKVGDTERGLLLLVASVGWGVSLAVFSQATTYALAVPLLMLMGLLSSLFMSLSMTLTQLNTTPEMRGRIMSINMMTFGLMPLGVLPAGVLADYLGGQTVVGALGLMLIVITALVLVTQKQLRRVQ